MFVPRSHGGFELDFIDGIEIIQALARIDGSVGMDRNDQQWGQYGNDFSASGDLRQNL